MRQKIRTIRKIRKIYLIINPSSGKQESILHIVNIAMKEAGISWEAFVTHKAGDATRYARNAVRTRVDAVAVYGGDGAIMEVVSGLAGSRVPLVILPGGTSNVLASELGIPFDLKESCALMRMPLTLKRIDIGRHDNAYFMVCISIGFGAALVKGADREAKEKNGILAYFFSAAAALKTLKRVRYHLTIDGKSYDTHGYTCIIANAGNLGFTRTSMDRHIDVRDGLLDVIIIRRVNFSLLLHIILMLINRERPHDRALVHHWQGKDITVSSTSAQTVQCDGEMLKKIPAHITVIPSAIQVVVPHRQ